MEVQKPEVNKQEKLTRLLKRYFKLSSQEVMVSSPYFKEYETPKITKELDDLEIEIRALKRELATKE